MRAWQVLNKIWQWLNRDRRVGELLIALAVTYLIVMLLPQAPVTATEGGAYAQWLAERRPALGDWTPTLSTLGLLTFRTSLWMRALLALLALVVTARAVALVERWSAWPARRRWLTAIGCVGGLLVLLGWGAQVLLGWMEPEVITWPGSPVTLAHLQRPVAPPKTSLPLLSERYGLYLIPQGHSVGLEIQAEDMQGQPLPLARTGRSSPQATLRIALTQASPDAYFALEQAGYIFRVSRRRDAGQGGAAPAVDVRVQVYRSATGDLLVEASVEDDDMLLVNDVRVQFEPTTLPRFEAVYNPGAPLEVLGLLLLAVSVVGRRLGRQPAPAQELAPERAVA